MKYKTCPYCSAHLDFGERCDCQAERPSASIPVQRTQKDSASILRPTQRKEVKTSA